MKDGGRGLSGRHVLLMLVGAFGVIVAANLALAIAAVRSFPGMDIRNSYVASQQFERKRQLQEQLGWTSSADYDPGRLRVLITGADGLPVQPERFAARLGRPTHNRDDLWPEFHFDGRHLAAAVQLDPGYWNIDISASSADGQPFQQMLKLWVSTKQQ